MTLWDLIIFSAITAFAFRLLPFLIKGNTLLHNTQGSFYRFLGYSTQSMLGVIIYDSAFNSKNLGILISSFDWLDAVKIILLVSMFIFVARTKNLLTGFFAGLGIYFLCILR